jgi:HlyD family secretion protein
MKHKIYTVLLGLLILAACGKKTEETKPIRKDVTETVFASGILEAKNTYTLKAQTDGYLAAVNFEEGDLVQAGVVLATVDNKENSFNNQSAKDLFEIAKSNTQSNAPALLQALNTININKQKLQLDVVQYERYKKLWNENSVAKIDFENIELQYKTSKGNYESAIENYKLIKQQANQQEISNKALKSVNNAALSKNQVRAVFSGKIYKRYKQLGDYITKGEAIALIGEQENIYAKVNVDETNIGKIKVGQEALVQLNTNKNKTYKGKITEIYPSFDEATQSFICKITFKEPLDFAIVNTQLQANVVVDFTKNALLVPRNYVDFGGFVTLKETGKKVKITTKFSSNEWVQVLSGIDENTILVTDNITENKTTTSEVGAQLGPK